jgi:hypothetical protein
MNPRYVRNKVDGLPWHAYYYWIYAYYPSKDVQDIGPVVYSAMSELCSISNQFLCLDDYIHQLTSTQVITPIPNCRTRTDHDTVQ